MHEVTELFNIFVFPVAMCILLIWFMYKKIWPRIETNLDRVTKTNEELSTSNRVLTENLVKKVDHMDNKLDKVLREKGEN
ncbi:hypothetical protein NSA50_19485 [Clostridium sp. DSM 100503]|uniref:hypothetical protein n=1 Tax=Clostridium sp. DSM 100503 TaxID=2963282 RepID=UPI00214A633D|nr:hypothetical protein [Clostridium sp. DSM 100503]MCR1953171.1 hypothetical protein [Clostridium sp. DSM 100503]